MSSTVSIIVPVYNAAPFLKECLDSILNQSYSNLEIILVDDGSTDQSSEICTRYKTKDSRIVFIRQENQGVSAARNAGIEAATGKYIQFVDSDDWVSPEITEILVQGLESEDVQMSVCGREEIVFDGDRIVSQKKHRIAPGIKDTRLFSEVPPWPDRPEANHTRNEMFQPYARLLIRDIIVSEKIRFDPRLFYSEDFEFLYRYYSRSSRLLSIDRTPYFYRQRPGNMTCQDTVLPGYLKKNWLENFSHLHGQLTETLDRWSGLSDEQKRKSRESIESFSAESIVTALFVLRKYDSFKAWKDIRQIGKYPVLQQAMPYYAPRKGDSRWLPFFLKRGCFSLAYAALWGHILKDRIKRLLGIPRYFS